MQGFFKVLGPVGALVLLAAGCGGGAAPTATRASQPTATRPAAAAATATPAATRPPTPTPGKAKPAGRVVTAQPDLGREFVVPYKAQSGSDEPHHQAMYDSILVADEAGNVISELAEGFTVSADGLTWTFKWRKGPLFHDGTAITAKDGEYSQRLFTATGNFSAGNVGRSLESVTAVDDSTLIFKMKSPYPLLPRFLSQIVGFVIPKAYHERVGEDEFTKNPVGSGAFKLVNRQPGNRWEFEAFDRYWKDGPFIQSLVLRIIPEAATRMAALKAGEVDLITGVGAQTELEEIRRDSKLYALEVPGGGRTNISFDAFYWNPNTPWRIKEVRQAGNYAVDKKAIADKFWGGKTVPHLIHTSPYTWGWDDRLRDYIYPYDPEKAKQLLRQAGFPNGFDTTLEFHGHPTIPAMEDVLQFVAAQLTAVGIRTKLFPVEHGIEVGKFFEGTAEWDMHMYAGSVAEDPRGVAQFFLASRKHGKNYSTYTDDWVDERLAAMLSEVDDKKARALWFDIVKRGLEEAFYIELPAPSSYYGVNKRLADWYRTKARPYLHNYEYMKLVAP
ncbi:MAG: ABC transporter substrate-binding protein [Chloroflexi bacterium]|nr:ABC transporter substrate-binding protein [Chloroflexota bacterium]